MTYRELIVKLMKMPASTLDQKIIMFNEEDEGFYGCTGHDVHVSIEDHDPIAPGQLFLMVNI